MLDQPAGVMAKMAYLDGIYRATNGYYSANDSVKWAEANPELWELYAKVRQFERDR